MALSNTPQSYGSVTRGFHWLTALLILTLIPVAVIANELPYDTSAQLARKAWAFSLHKTLGIAVFFVSLARILWALSQPKPAPLHAERRSETFLAETAHWLLYGSLVLAPLSGWIHHASTSGFAPIWWPLGQTLPLIPRTEAMAALTGGAHWVLGKVMAATILLHIAGALKHQLLDRDATLARMLRGTAVATPPARHSRSPLIAALAIWAATLGAGSAFGLYAPHTSPVQAATLAQVTSDWQVQEGEIAIAVTQFGSTVGGSFDDWTAEISFDPTVTEGKAGEVEVVIAIGSLTLGTVTSQAMGPDFFDVETYETAVFAADLMAGSDGYSAQGSLTIKDQTVPLTMPFDLSLGDDTARARAELALDRRDFAIGQSMGDESSLAFAVRVTIALSARRGPLD